MTKPTKWKEALGCLKYKNDKQEFLAFACTCRNYAVQQHVDSLVALASTGTVHFVDCNIDYLNKMEKMTFESADDSGSNIGHVIHESHFLPADADMHSQPSHSPSPHHQLADSRRRRRLLLHDTKTTLLEILALLYYLSSYVPVVTRGPCHLQGVGAPSM